MKDRYGLIIIGAGAAGLAAAVKAAEKGLKVLLLEKSDRPGRKILASGNGRCNLMNLLPFSRPCVPAWRPQGPALH